MEQYQDVMLKLKKLKDTTKLEAEIWDFLDCLMGDLEICKTHNRSLEKQLENMTNQDEQSIPTTYVRIREENSYLKERNSELDEKLKNLEKNLEEMKQHYNRREKEFFDELQMAQVTSALDFDKIEQKLKWQLADANKQLQQGHIIITKLQTQLRNMEETQKYSPNAALYLNPVNDAIFKENKTREQQLEEYSTNKGESFKMLEKVVDNSVVQHEVVPTAHNGILRTYESLQVKCSVASEDKTGTLGNPGKSITPLFKGKNYVPKRWNGNKSKNSTMIPPLMPCSSSKSITNKRRRLHDPEDLSYLVQLMGDDENDG